MLTSIRRIHGVIRALNVDFRLWFIAIMPLNKCKIYLIIVHVCTYVRTYVCVCMCVGGRGGVGRYR